MKKIKDILLYKKLNKTFQSAEKKKLLDKWTSSNSKTIINNNLRFLFIERFKNSMLIYNSSRVDYIVPLS